MIFLLLVKKKKKLNLFFFVYDVDEYTRCVMDSVLPMKTVLRHIWDPDPNFGQRWTTLILLVVVYKIILVVFGKTKYR